MKLFLFLITISFASISASQDKTYHLGVYGDIQITHPQLVSNIKKAWALAGLDMQFADLPAQRSLQSAASGKIDGDIYRFTSTVENLPQLIQIPVVIDSNGHWVYVLPSTPCFDLDQIGQKILVGVIGIHYFKKVYALSNSAFIEVESPISVMKLLKNNRAEYTVANESTVNALIKQTGIQLKRCFDQPLLSNNAYTYIHSNNVDILHKLTLSYQQIFEKDR